MYMGLVPLITLCTWVWVYRFTHLWYHLPPLTGFCSGTPPLPPPPLIHTHYTRSPLVVVRAGTCIWLLVGVGRGEGVHFLGLKAQRLGATPQRKEYSYIYIDSYCYAENVQWLHYSICLSFSRINCTASATSSGDTLKLLVWFSCGA